MEFQNLKINLRCALTYLFIFFIHLSANSAVWENKYRWTDLWEEAYSKWVVAYWKFDVYTNPSSILYNIPTDCADASYNMRALFSFNYGLPFRARNLTNSTKLYDSINDPVLRFRAFIIGLNKITDTNTLADDTYPVGITRKEFRPGIIFIVRGWTNHSAQIVGLSDYGIPDTLDSTEPSLVRKLTRRHAFPQYSIENISSGYRAFRWPEEYSVTNEKNLKYKMDQYKLIAKTKYTASFFDELAEMLRLIPDSVDRKIERLSKLICDETRYRIQSVEEALEFILKKETGYCMSGSEYSDYSTPVRDASLKYVFTEARKIYEDSDKMSKITLATQSKLDSIFKANGSSATWCPLVSKSGLHLDLFDVYSAIQNKKLLTDPNANERVRWGIEPETSRCPRYK